MIVLLILVLLVLFMVSVISLSLFFILCSIRYIDAIFNICEYASSFFSSYKEIVYVISTM